MFGFKKLKKRIRSLEDFLDVSYSPEDSKDDYAEHYASEYGRMNDLDKVVRERRKDWNK